MPRDASLRPRSRARSRTVDGHGAAPGAGQVAVERVDPLTRRPRRRPTRDRDAGDGLHPAHRLVLQQGGGVAAEEDPADLGGPHGLDDGARVGGVDPDHEPLREAVARGEPEDDRRAGDDAVAVELRADGGRGHGRGDGRRVRRRERPDRDEVLAATSPTSTPASRGRAERARGWGGRENIDAHPGARARGSRSPPGQRGTERGCPGRMRNSQGGMRNCATRAGQVSGGTRSPRGGAGGVPSPNGRPPSSSRPCGVSQSRRRARPGRSPSG